MRPMLLPILIVAIVVLLAAIWWERTKRRLAEQIEGMMAADDAHCVTKHDQVSALREVGIVLPEEQELRLLWHSDPEQSEFYARYPYWGMLSDPQLCWNCVYSPGDSECIDEKYAYRPILEGLFRISGLPVTQVQGMRRYEAEFHFAEKQIFFHAKENRDWIDASVGGFLNQQIPCLLPDTTHRFYLDDRHNAPLWLWATEEQVAAVNARTGLHFHRS